MAPVFRTFLSKNGCYSALKALQLQGFLFLALCVRLPIFSKSKIFFSTEKRHMDDFIEKAPRKRLHIPAMFCTLKSCEDGFHCKIGHISPHFRGIFAPRCTHGDTPLLF